MPRGRSTILHVAPETYPTAQRCAMCLFKFPTTVMFIDPRFTLRSPARVCQPCGERILAAESSHNVADTAERDAFIDALPGLAPDPDATVTSGSERESD